jgi:hypothetical protein
MKWWWGPLWSRPTDLWTKKITYDIDCVKCLFSLPHDIEIYNFGNHIKELAWYSNVCCTRNFYWNVQYKPFLIELKENTLAVYIFSIAI